MSRRTPLALEIVIVGGIAAALHYVASTAGLYYSVSWIDTIVHFTGGFWVGLVALFVFFTQGWLRLPSGSGHVVAAVTLLSVLSVALGWELYEVYASLVNVPADLLNTLSDLFFDMLGGFASLWYFGATLVSRENSNG